MVLEDEILSVGKNDNPEKGDWILNQVRDDTG